MNEEIEIEMIWLTMVLKGPLGKSVLPSPKTLGST